MGRDPISFSAKELNLYRYVANNPMNANDPTGMMCNILLNCATENFGHWWISIVPDIKKPERQPWRAGFWPGPSGSHFGKTGQWYDGDDPGIKKGAARGKYEVGIYDTKLDEKCSNKVYKTKSPKCAVIVKCVKDAVAAGKAKPPVYGGPIVGGAVCNCRDRSEDLLEGCCLKWDKLIKKFTYNKGNYKKLIK